jgi:hypothetical protein
MKAAVPLMMGLAGMLMNNPIAVPKIPSHKIEAKEEVQLLSKRATQKLKGKKARRNRGNNR